MTEKNIFKRILSHRIVDEIKLRRFVKKSMFAYGPEVWSIFSKEGTYTEYLILFNMTFYNTNLVPKTNVNFLLEIARLENLPFYHKISVDDKILHQIQIDVQRLNSNYVNKNVYKHILIYCY